MASALRTLHQPLTAEALIFDIDGTLLLSDIPTRRMWRGWAARHGLDADRVLEASAGKRTLDTVRLFCPPGLSPEDEAAALERQEVTDLEGITPVRGVVGFLQSLPPERWAIATSSGPELARARLGAAGIAPPERMVTGQDVAQGKPDPEVFVRAARALGFDPAQTLVFEDAAAGVEAATRAGAGVVLVNTADAPELDRDRRLDGRRIDDYTVLRAERRAGGGLRLVPVGG